MSDNVEQLATTNKILLQVIDHSIIIVLLMINFSIGSLSKIDSADKFRTKTSWTNNEI